MYIHYVLYIWNDAHIETLYGVHVWEYSEEVWSPDFY